MISMDAVVALCPRLERPVLERWIAEDWVRPEERDGDYGFQEIDLARVRLILELRDRLEVNEAALPVVLLLVDQLYDIRRQMRTLADAFTRMTPGDAALFATAILAGRAL